MNNQHALRLLYYIYMYIHAFVSTYTSAATLQGVCQKAVKGKVQMYVHHIQISLQSICRKIAKCFWY